MADGHEKDGSFHPIKNGQSHALKDGSSHPMKGVVLCCTSIPPDERDTYANQVDMMGGSHEANLIAQTTHLIVGQVGTAKYNFAAKERPDIRIVAPSFVPAARELWVAGEDFRLEDLEKQHALPTFWSCKICLTGLEVLEDRHRIQQLIVENGGEYHADLTKEVTHLLTWQPQGKKYQYALQWRIKTVGFEWLYQSLERGMILDEDLYLPTIPVEQRGLGAWKKPESNALGKRQRTEPLDRTAANSGSGGGPRKLRRIASVKLGSQNAALWKDIASSGGVERKKSGGDWDEIVDDPDSRQDQLEIKIKGESDGPKPQGIFSGFRFFTHGFNEKQTTALTTALTSHGGEIKQTADACEFDGNSYIIIIHTMKIADCRASYPQHDDSQYVTEWWVEQCLESKRFLPPQESVIWQPFRIWPLKGFENKVICSTGFQGLELLHISKLITLMGGKYDQYLSASSDLLVCKSAVRSEKLLGAWDWDVPSVVADWLWDSTKLGSAQSISKYAIKKPAAKKEERSGLDSGGASPGGTNSQVAIRAKHSCLNGFVIYISASLEGKHSKISGLARSLGASISDSLDSRPAVTHCLARSNVSVDDEIKKAQAVRGCHIVSLKWLNACAQKGTRANENEYWLNFSEQTSGAADSAAVLERSSTHTLANESAESLKSLRPIKGPSTPLEDLPPPGPNTSKPSATNEKVTDSVHATIAQMVKQMTGSGPGSGVPMSSILRRKPFASKNRKLLGRASSAASSVGQPEPEPEFDTNVEPEVPLEEIPPQSQALEYLDPEAAAVRERVLRKVQGKAALDEHQKPKSRHVAAASGAVTLNGGGRNLRRRD